jgi:hypothetical protein
VDLEAPEASESAVHAPPEPSAAGSRLRQLLPDAVAVAVLLALLPLVHDLGGYLRDPYWNDEAWVALSTKLRGDDLLLISSSTPVGWTLLLRLVPDPDYLRVVPLAFLALSIVAAYALGRLVFAGNRLVSISAGLVCGLAALLLPAQQVRHDLKQYTADAAMTLILFGLSLWCERGWRLNGTSRYRLAVLVATVPVSMLVSYVSAFAAVCVFVGLFVNLLVRRQFRQLIEVCVAGVVAALFIAVIYLTVLGPTRSPLMEQYWAAFFPTLGSLPAYLRSHLKGLTPYVGLPVTLVLVLDALAVVALLLRRYSGTAIAVPLLPLALVVLGLAKIYPFLDLRTSHFLIVYVIVLAAVGLVLVATTAARLVGRGITGRAVAAATVAVMMVLCAVPLGLYSAHNRRWYRFEGTVGSFQTTPMATEDVRSATRYVWTHREPGDLVLVNVGARRGFAFYWSQGPIRVVRSAETVGWNVELPGQPDVAFAQGRDAAAIRKALDGLLSRNASGPGTRIWLVRSHIGPQELAEWRTVIAGYKVEQITGGFEPLVRITENSATAA